MATPLPVVSMMYFLVSIPPKMFCAVSPAFSASSVKFAIGAVAAAPFAGGAMARGSKTSKPARAKPTAIGNRRQEWRLWGTGMRLCLMLRAPWQRVKPTGSAHQACTGRRFPICKIRWRKPGQWRQDRRNRLLRRPMSSVQELSPRDSPRATPRLASGRMWISVESCPKSAASLTIETMSKIHIPTPLRQYVGKQAAVDVTGTTVGEAMNALVAQHPDLKKHLYTDDGKLRAFVNLYVNDEDIRYLQKEATALKEGDNISIVPSIAGGAA